MFLRGDDLRFIELAESLAKRRAVAETLITEALLAPRVAGDSEGVAAELRERDGSMKLVGLKMIRAEVDVQALKLPNFLIVPAAGVVNDAGVIELLNVRCRVCRVELTPALVEGDPRADAREAVELGNHLGELGVVARARHRVGAGELFIVVVLAVDTSDKGRGDREKVVCSAAVYHVLPDEHAEAVAVIIPAQGLNFDVLAEHVEAHVLHELDIENHGVVARRSVESVREVPLIEHAVLEIRPAVEKQPGNAVFVFPNAD